VNNTEASRHIDELLRHLENPVFVDQVGAQALRILIAERDTAKGDLARYKRYFVLAACKDVYWSRARWTTKPNQYRSDGGLFVSEVCEFGHNKTHQAFPCQFEPDVANQIVELLNKATDELEGGDA
jgi:hypothetical protein